MQYIRVLQNSYLTGRHSNIGFVITTLQKLHVNEYTLVCLSTNEFSLEMASTETNMIIIVNDDTIRTVATRCEG